MLLALLLVIGGPAETIAGKYVQHSREFLAMYPPPAIEVPNPLPTEVDALCRLIEKIGPQPEFFAALGDALVVVGQPDLAYRAFDRAQRLGHAGELQRKKDKLDPVPDSVIEAEEREARAWVGGLQEYERERIRREEDPRHLGPFYERYGRPEQSLVRAVQVRQTAFWSAALATVLGLALTIGSGRLRRRVAAIPLALAALCLLGPPLGGPFGPYMWAAVVLGLTAAAIQLRGRPAA
ncbi:MAG: hypothetical protein ACYS0E_03010 [Planctomycetota bacterium]